MNTTVEKLLEVDRSARAMVEDARRYYDTTLQEIEQERDRIRETYTQRAAHHLEEISQSEAGVADDEIRGLRERYAALTAAMEAVYESCHGDWEEELFARCTDRERAR